MRPNFNQMTDRHDYLDYSLILPFHGEEENVRPVFTQISRILDKKQLYYKIHSCVYLTKKLYFS